MQSGFASARDRAIPGLQSVLNPSVFSTYLSPVLPARWGKLSEIQVEVLQQHHGSRCTVNLMLQTTDGRHQLIGKLYATDRADVFRVMRDISESGFGPETDFSIPRPLAYLTELNLLLQEKVYGAVATEIFSGSSERERVRAAERCSRWLAHFHMYAPMTGPAFELTHDLIESWLNRLGKPSTSFADKALQLSERLQDAEAAIGSSEKCACHGGFWHHNILLSESRVSAFDWDHHCAADPARDVAKFIIELEQLALKSHGSLDSMISTIQAFYQTYVSISRFQVAASLPLHKAAVCLKRAKHHLRRVGGGLGQAEAMLDEGLRALAEGL